MSKPSLGNTSKRIGLILLLSAFVLLIWVVYPAALINPAPLKNQRPNLTALIKLRMQKAKRRGEPYRIDQRWVPLSGISPHLKKAVRVAEDAGFWKHSGVDWDEARETVKYNWQKKRFARGASTITMQLARNLYLTPSKNPIRKLQEILIAYRLEKTLSKSRILELYLNVVEWGKGIFGAEAAARHYFHKSAADLDVEEAARLAAVLPNPLHWKPNSQRKIVLQRSQIILQRMGAGTPPR